MIPLGPIDLAEATVLKEARTLLDAVRRLAANDPKTISEAIAMLRGLRTEVYEDLNQLQHEHLIIRSARWLHEYNPAPANAAWLWNPRQTGDESEPDLAAVVEGIRVVSAEVTASAKPQGVIDTRMRRTLEKLNRMEGAKYYFVCADAMCRRATTKVRNGGWDIQVVSLGEVT